MHFSFQLIAYQLINYYLQIAEAGQYWVIATTTFARCNNHTLFQLRYRRDKYLKEQMNK